MGWIWDNVKPALQMHCVGLVETEFGKQSMHEEAPVP
jgi:hypothetical protein